MTKPDDFNVLCKKLNRIIQKDYFEGQFITWDSTKKINSLSTVYLHKFPRATGSITFSHKSVKRLAFRIRLVYRTFLSPA